MVFEKEHIRASLSSKQRFGVYHSRLSFYNRILFSICFRRIYFLKGNPYTFVVSNALACLIIRTVVRNTLHYFYSSVMANQVSQFESTRFRSSDGRGLLRHRLLRCSIPTLSSTDKFLAIA